MKDPEPVKIAPDSEYDGTTADEDIIKSRASCYA